MAIHPTAIVERGASLDPSVEVGPYAVIGAHLTIGAGTKIGPHAVLEGRTTIGKENQIFQFAALGAAPQDLKYRGEETRLEIGDRNQIREFATMHLGTEGGGGVTRIGSGNLFMAYSHVAHDCVVGDGCILDNSVALAGHVRLEDRVILGGLSGVHQFVRLGRRAFIGAGSIVTMDVPPFCMAQGDRARLTGLNTVGLTRDGLSPEALAELKRAYRALFREEAGLRDAIASVKGWPARGTEVEELIAFLESSERGITR